jgi:hypothetical protein
MRGTRLRSTGKSAVAILCAACFLTVSLGSISRAVAADSFETWPKKTTEPGVEPKQGTDNGAVMAGDAAGKKAETGLSSGTIGWIALGAAAIIGIAVAAGGGGGGGSTSNH